MEIEIKKEMKDDKYDEYEIKRCASVIMEAEEIKADEKKMKKVKEYLAKKAKGIKKTISSIAELRDVAQEKAEEEMDD